MQFFFDFIFEGRANTDITDFLDLTANSEFATRPRNETCYSIYREWKQGYNTYQADGDTESPAGVSMNHIANEKSRCSSKNYRCRQGTTLNPYGSRIHMCICHIYGS